MNTIVQKILPWCKDRKGAKRWHYSVIIPSLGSTAHEIVKEGNYKIMLRDLERIDLGVFS